jgi:NADPH:quinone reductase-like Zn-dependent oxidoreductase
VFAARFHHHGDPGVLVFEEVPDPVPRAGEVLVRVRACALNHLDLWQRRGMEKVRIPLPHVSGADIAGEVAAGRDAGTRVLLQPGVSCGRCAACVAGLDNRCPAYDLLGYMRDGGYAELVAVPEASLVAIPPGIGFVEAAAFPLTFLTAWHMLASRAQLRPGEDVLVLAAGSGVGQAAVQIARLLGARVIATAGGEEKLARARALGAHDVVDHYAADLFAEVRRLTGRRGVDVVVEHVGAATWERSVRALARGGRLVTCGATTGPSGPLDLRVLFTRQLSLLGSYMGTRAELLDVARFFFDGRLRPVVDRTFPLREAADAHRRLEAGAAFGKIVLEC